MSVRLKNTTDNGEAAVASYGTAAILTTIPTAGPASQITFRHTGTAGIWYVKLKRAAGPSSTDYSIKLLPKESFTEDNPPIGAVWALASGAADGPLSWYLGYRL